MTQSSYSLTAEALTVLAGSFTDQADTLGTVISGSDLANDSYEAVVGGMEEAWGPAGSFADQRALYTVPREAALSSLEVLVGILKNIGQAITDLSQRYQAAESTAGSGFTQVGGDLGAAGG